MNSYMKRLKEVHKKDNPNSVLNMKTARVSWSKLTAAEKKRFKETNEEESSGRNAVAKIKRKSRDAVYRNKQNLKKQQEEKEKEQFVKEFEKILTEKKQKLVKLTGDNSDIQKEISAAKTEAAVMLTLVKDLTEEENMLKAQVKEALSHHKTCRK